MRIFHAVALIISLMAASTASALDVLDYLTDKEGKYTGPTVEENVAKMDIDKSGFADVSEVRAFLILKHGADYQKAVLSRWEINATSNSCGTTSFVEDLTE